MLGSTRVAPTRGASSRTTSPRVSAGCEVAACAATARGRPVLLGWLMWLRAWLGAARPRLGAAELVAGAGDRDASWIALPDGWARERAYHRPPEVVAVAALLRRLGSPKLFFQIWRRLMCRWTTLSRAVRGDARLPAACVRRPDGGPEPPNLPRDHLNRPYGIARTGFRARGGAWAIGRCGERMRGGPVMTRRGANEMRGRCPWNCLDGRAEMSSLVGEGET